MNIERNNLRAFDAKSEKNNAAFPYIFTAIFGHARLSMAGLAVELALKTRYSL